MTLFDVPLPAAEVGEAGASLTRVKLLVAYDGSSFHGFAANQGVTTVAGTLEQALELVLRHAVSVTGAGRTDRGVHAWGQVVTFDTSARDLDLDALRHSINRMCAPSIVVRDAQSVDAGFDARFSARSRVYRYSVLNTAAPDPFLAATSWWVEQPLDLRSMQLACDPLIGEHDFASFCRRPKRDGDDGALVRRVIDARWTAPPTIRSCVLLFEIEAQAFCHQMVRSIVGTLVEIGNGKKRAGDMTGILRSTDRGRAGQLAPPQGLCLWEVRY